MRLVVSFMIISTAFSRRTLRTGTLLRAMEEEQVIPAPVTAAPVTAAPVTVAPVDAASGLPCSDITTLEGEILEHPLTKCCSNSDCEAGKRCKNLNYYLKCIEAPYFTSYYPEVCNEEPIPGGRCGAPAVPKRQPDCIPEEDIDRDVFGHGMSSCLLNAQCDRGVKCRVIAGIFTACDNLNYFNETYPEICDGETPITP